MDICVAYVHKLGYVYQGYVYQNINRKLVCLYLILGVLKLKSLRSNCSKYGFVSVINDLTGLLMLMLCACVCVDVYTFLSNSFYPSILYSCLLVDVFMLSGPYV